MKKLFIAAFFALTFVSSTFAAGKTNPGFTGAENFNKTFPHATSIVAKTVGRFTKVDFIWNNLSMAAFYDEDGAWYATSRDITVQDLPVASLLKLQKEYPDFKATEAIELSMADTDRRYFVTIKSAGKTYILEVANGSISVFKKMMY